MIYERVKLNDGTRVVKIFGCKVFSYRRRKFQGGPSAPKICISGIGNILRISNQNNPKLEIYINGNNNVIECDTLEYFEGTIYVGTPDCPTSNCTIRIGENTTSNGCIIRCLEDNTSISIGKDCMLSSNIFIHGSDTHCVFDMDGNLLNLGRSVEIGNHVWVGMNCSIFKNSKIPDNCIVGLGAVVSSKFSENNSIIAGVPAKIVKTHINWDRKRPQQHINSSVQDSLHA